jgi:hypothetical protein
MFWYVTLLVSAQLGFMYLGQKSSTAARWPRTDMTLLIEMETSNLHDHSLRVIAIRSDLDDLELSHHTYCL